jgi:hypothetical protein
MARKAKKPEGFKAFDALTRKLVKVPKAEVDRRIEQRKARIAKRKK